MDGQGSSGPSTCPPMSSPVVSIVTGHGARSTHRRRPGCPTDSNLTTPSCTTILPPLLRPVLSGPVLVHSIHPSASASAPLPERLPHHTTSCPARLTSSPAQLRAVAISHLAIPCRPLQTSRFFSTSSRPTLVPAHLGRHLGQPQPVPDPPTIYRHHVRPAAPVFCARLCFCFSVVFAICSSPPPPPSTR